MSDITRWRSCSGVPRGCVNIILLWSVRRDDHSGVLIGEGVTCYSDVGGSRDGWELLAEYTDSLHWLMFA